MSPTAPSVSPTTLTVAAHALKDINPMEELAVKSKPAPALKSTTLNLTPVSVQLVPSQLEVLVSAVAHHVSAVPPLVVIPAIKATTQTMVYALVAKVSAKYVLPALSALNAKASSPSHQEHVLPKQLVKVKPEPLSEETQSLLSVKQDVQLATKEMLMLLCALKPSKDTLSTRQERLSNVLNLAKLVNPLTHQHAHPVMVHQCSVEPAAQVVQTLMLSPAQVTSLLPMSARMATLQSTVPARHVQQTVCNAVS